MVKKSSHQIGMALGNEKEMMHQWIQYENIIIDRGSKYSVTAGQVNGKDDIKMILKELKKKKKYQKATHHSYAVRIRNNEQIWDLKNDDGETGAGMTILRQIQKSDYINIIIIVTRWFGGTMLHGDRFTHIQNATKHMLQKIETSHCNIP
jgi:putative IMPACT (imprinted ancient) family translation regulator